MSIYEWRLLQRHVRTKPTTWSRRIISSIRSKTLRRRLQLQRRRRLCNYREARHGGMRQESICRIRQQGSTKWLGKTICNWPGWYDGYFGRYMAQWSFKRIRNSHSSYSLFIWDVRERSITRTRNLQK